MMETSSEYGQENATSAIDAALEKDDLKRDDKDEFKGSERVDRKIGIALGALKEKQKSIHVKDGQEAVDLAREVTNLMFKEGKDSAEVGTKARIEELERIAVEMHLLSLAQSPDKGAAIDKDIAIAQRLRELQSMADDKKKILSTTPERELSNVRSGQEIMDDLAKKIIAKQGNSVNPS